MRPRIAWLAAVPPAVLWIAVAAFGVDVPYWDQWELVPAMEAMYAGELELAELWRPHHEHRLFFPKAIYFGLARLTDWNIRAEMGVSCFLAVGIFAILVAILRRPPGSPRLRLGPHPNPLPEGEGVRRRDASWVVVAFSCLVFGLPQFENWLWGLQLDILLSILATVAGLWALQSKRRSALALAIGAGVVASYSFITGLLFWPAAMPVVLARRPRAARAAVWSIAWAVVTLFYFDDFVSYPKKAWGLRELSEVKDLLIYFFLYLGSPLGDFGKWTVFAGLAGVVLLGYFGVRVWRSGELSRCSPWIALGLFALMSAALTALGRLEFGVGQALTSRYVTIANSLWLALPALALVSTRRGTGNGAPRIVAGTAVLIVVLLLPYSVSSWRAMGELAERRERAAQALLRGDLGPEVEVVFPEPEELRDEMEILERRGLSLYRDHRVSSDTRGDRR